MKPRIMMVIAQFWPIVGGAEVQCGRLAKALVERNYSVQILTGRWDPAIPEYQEVEGIAVFRNKVVNFLNLKTIMSFSYLLSLAWELWRRRDTFDIIHVHQALRSAYISAIMAKLLKKPIIVKVGSGGRTYDLGMLKAGKDAGCLKYLDFLMWPAIRHCQRLVAISHEIESQLRGDGFSEKQVVRIPNGLPIPPISRKARRRPGKWRIVTLGRLDGLKGIDTLIEAAELVQDATFHIGGRGPLEAEFQSLVRSKGLTDRVFFEGLIEDTASFLESADIFALPSRTEGMSNTLLEAMAHRLPCIVTPVGGNKDVITDGVNGLLVPTDNPAALAAAIRRLIEDREVRARLAEAGRETVAAKYSMEIVAQRYAGLYAEIISSAQD